MAAKGLCGCGLVVCLAVAAGGEEPRNLLQLPTAALAPTATTASAAEARALRDGDIGTVSGLRATPDAPATLVFEFGGATVSPERLVITLAGAADSKPPARVDLLVSTLSPHAGFQSVRVDSPAATAQPQEFPFAPIGARWVMLRFTPMAGANVVEIAEIAVLGRPGPPVTHYEFKESPATALEVLRRLAKTTALDVAISKDEAALFEDAKDGKFDDWSFAEAALFSSGVTDRGQRRAYLARLDQLAAEAARAVSNARTPFDKGRALLKFLHSGPLAKGYQSQQTDVSVVLDTGAFNCVSSATLYAILARRIGLDCRAVEVPEHAFAIVYDGANHADVETTTAEGFNPSRDPAAQEKFKELTGFSYIPNSNRDQRRELGEVGLVAITYYNHGVELSRKKQFHAALLAYFRAMSLDAESASAVKNALAGLANWSVELAGDKKYEEALSVVATGLALAPKDATLVNNHGAIWSEWAEALIAEGKSDEALAVLRRAARAVPAGNFLRMQAWVFIRPGEDRVKAGDWMGARAVLAPGSKKLDGEPLQELQQWGVDLHQRWAQAELKAGRFDQALAAIDRGRELQFGEGEFDRQLAYVMQEAAAALYARDGAAKAQTFVVETLRRNPKLKELREVAAAHSHRVVKDLTDHGKTDEALAFALGAGKAIGDESLATDLAHLAFDEQARKFTKQADWPRAIEVYVQALRRSPGDKHFENNLAATWSAWAETHAEAKQYADVLKVYEQALQSRHPDPPSLHQNILFYLQEWSKDVSAKEGAEAAEKLLAQQAARFSQIKDVDRVMSGHFQRLVKELSDARKYKEALAVVGRARRLVTDEQEIAGLAARVYDTWAEELSRKGQWQAALDVYAGARKQFPKDGRLENNAVVTWHQWAKTFIDKKDWPAAIAVYERAVKQFPDNGTLSNNLEYCREQSKKTP